jgi:hypothetical protein
LDLALEVTTQEYQEFRLAKAGPHIAFSAFADRQMSTLVQVLNSRLDVIQSAPWSFWKPVMRF